MFLTYDLNLIIILDYLFGQVLDTVTVISIFFRYIRQIRTLRVFSRILLLLHFFFLYILNNKYFNLLYNN